MTTTAKGMKEQELFEYLRLEEEFERAKEQEFSEWLDSCEEKGKESERMNQDKFFRIIILATFFFSAVAAVEGFYLIKAVVKVGHLVMGVA